MTLMDSNATGSNWSATKNIKIWVWFYFRAIVLGWIWNFIDGEVIYWNLHKMADILYTTFQIHFRECHSLHLDLDSTETCCYVFNWQNNSSLAHIMARHLTCIINYDPSHWRIYASPHIDDIIATYIFPWELQKIAHPNSHKTKWWNVVSDLKKHFINPLK